MSALFTGSGKEELEHTFLLVGASFVHEGSAELSGEYGTRLWLSSGG